ncbi:MAG TPA: alpha/beta fold hydrolase [Xanthobacteraceae bacterium]|jgi:alpha-beta hydrolase superfamily lysophospholipase
MPIVGRAPWRAWTIVLLLWLATAAALSGPLFPFAPRPSEVAYAVAEAPDIDAYLRQREALHPDVRRDLAKTILWNDPAAHGTTPLSLVYIHGFSASRKDVTPVVETLASTLRANAFLTRLAAHGSATGAEFATVTAQDWLDDAREALAVGRRVGERVILIGTSTGALLATMVALDDNSPRIAALVLLSPNFGLRDWRAKFISGPLGRVLARVVIGREHSFRPDSPGHAEFWTSRFPSEGIVALMDLLNYARSIHLDHLEIPTLIIYTHKDTVVDTQAIQDRFDEIRAPAKLIVDLPEASRHELTGNALAPETVQPVVRRIVAFLADSDVLGAAFLERNR